MNDEIKKIQDLLNKYMDGATSNEEEATLRKYFEEHGNDIPAEWESYRALFSYIGFEQMNLSQILKEEEKEENIEKKEASRSMLEQIDIDELKVTEVLMPEKKAQLIRILENLKEYDNPVIYDSNLKIE